MILNQRHLDYGKHCQASVGTYVQVHDQPGPPNTNINAPRTMDYIYLRYDENLQDGHGLFQLDANSCITNRRDTPVPITPAVIQQVHLLAMHDSMREGLKITSYTGQILYDSAWIAGVDLSDNNEEVEDIEDNEAVPDSDSEDDND